MKKIILDASSAILLFKTGLCEQLFEVYQVFITESVFNELTQSERPGKIEFQEWLADNRFSVTPVHEEGALQKVRRSQFSGLDMGEADTIRSFEKGYADFILTDDGRAAGYCKKNAIPFINGLLVPKVLCFSHKISADTCNNKMEFLINIGRYSERIITWAMDCPKESLDFFLS